MRIAVNGTTLFFDVEGPKLVADGPDMVERPTVVLLHGGPGFDHSNFKPEFSRLAEVAQLVYLDHRGNGRSDRDDAGTWTLDTWADDVRAFCDALEIVGPVVLGWSFGSIVAMHYAARHPGHASKLILQSPAARMDPERIASAFEEVGGDAAGAAAREFWLHPSNEALSQYLEHCIPLYHSAPLDLQMARSVLNVDLLTNGFERLGNMDLQEELAQVVGPVLVLAGRQDPITPLSAAEETVAALTGADVTFEVFDRSAHFIHLSEPERFFGTVRAFIVSGGPPA
jgi:pimeloyl-ACP methyl ester carboxylesterase